jgi:amidase
MNGNLTCVRWADYTPAYDSKIYPRQDVHVPSDAENRLHGWACKAKVAGKPEGILQGREVVLKDNICLADVPCQFGSDLFEDYIRKPAIPTPLTWMVALVVLSATVDATVATRVLDQGAIIVGKATCEVH